MIATPIGILISILGIAGGFIMEGGSPMVAFSNPAAILIIIGGTVGVGMASNSMSDIGPGVKATLKMLLPGKNLDGAAAVNELMEYADIARREGLLALEEKAKAVEDPFMKRGLELVIDGTDSDEVADALGQEIEAQRERHKVAAKYFADMGAYAPTIGIIGTVIGLINVLQNLSDPGSLGPMISAAFIATLWGVLSANFFWLPMGTKILRISDVQAAQMELLVEGITEIQAGTSPRAVRQKLTALVPPSEVAREAA